MIFFIPSFATAQSLEGVWSVVESIRSTDGGVESLGWPGVMIFTNEHISYSLVTTDQSRPSTGPGSADSDRLAAWGNYSSAVGTYRFNGSYISGNWLLNINPQAQGGSFNWEVNELTETTFSFTTGNTRYNFERVE